MVGQVLWCVVCCVYYKDVVIVVVIILKGDYFFIWVLGWKVFVVFMNGQLVGYIIFGSYCLNVFLVGEGQLVIVWVQCWKM